MIGVIGKNLTSDIYYWYTMIVVIVYQEILTLKKGETMTPS